MTHLNRNLVSYDNYGDIRIEENGKKCLDPRNEFVIMESSRKRTNVNRRKKQ